MRLLVVEDEPDLNRQLVGALTDAGYVVDKAMDGEEGHFLGDTEPYDAVVLDLGLPVLDGVSVLEKWRRTGKKMPVLILTARDRWSDKVAGFDAGADDYVAKPFHMEEVLARIRALLRRSAGHATSEISCGPLMLDTKSAGLPLGALTNDLADFHGQEWVDKQDWLEYFDTIVDASYTGVMKPDPRAFTAGAGALGLPPEQIVYLDDMPWNVDAARVAGLQGIAVSYVDSTPAIIEARTRLGLTT